MIVVIADDLSGAAEVANAALEAGLSAAVQLRFDSASDAEVVCVSTGTRSLSPASAATTVEVIARSIAAARPELVYKKCDSLLRGPVAAESVAIARALGRSRILLIPANPSRNRIIRGGVYFVDGVPLAESALAADPEHPRQTSIVAQLLGDTASIETPDAESNEDMLRHARTVDDSTLAVGAVDFFAALLATRMPPAQRVVPETAYAAEGVSLFVCGSRAAWLTGRSEQFASHGIPVLPMARALEDPQSVALVLREFGAAALATSDEHPALDSVARAVKAVIEQTSVARVFLEGGATATAVVEHLGFERFHAEASPGPGVGALRPVGYSGPLFLIKPGSYPWPDSVTSRARIR